MKRNVHMLFVNGPTPFLDDGQLEPPLGMLLMEATLLQSDARVTVLDLSGLSIEESLRKLEEIPEAPDIVGFSTSTASYHITLRLASKARELFQTAVLLAGGPHASALPFEVVNHFDHVLVGEGDQAVVELVEGWKREQPLPAIVNAPPVRNLDELPFPAYQLVDLGRYTRRIDGAPCLSVLTSRGCTHDCAFCNSRVSSRGRRNLRLRSPEHVASEIAELKNVYGIEHIRFQDDMFTVSVERVRAIMNLSPPITYRCFARADALTPEMCQLLADTGCCQIAVGVESGSGAILQAMCKGLTPGAVRVGLLNAHRAGLSVRIYLIVGFPGETDDTIEETKRFLATVPFDEFMVHPAIPYPGTPIYADPKKFGITWIDPDFSKYVQIGKERQTAYVLETYDFNRHRVRQWRTDLIRYLEVLGATWYDTGLWQTACSQCQ